MDIGTILKVLIEAASGQFGVVAQVLTAVVSVMGAVRMVMKPLMPALHAIVAAIPGDFDDKLLAAVEAHPITKALAFLVDYVLSIKPPPKKQ